MLLRGVIEICIFLFSIYGFLSLLIATVNSLCLRCNLDKSDIRMIIMVKNQEDVIEGVVRNIITSNISKKLIYSKNLMIVDMGSTDDTLKILRRLERYYKIIDIYTVDECDKIFDSYNKKII